VNKEVHIDETCLAMRVVSEDVLLPGKVGLLEAILDKPKEQKDGYIAVCCHPHPLHGGAMGNKVVYTSSRALAGLGIPSLRFNFRGVGNSEGSYSDGIGEQQDLAAVAKWTGENYPNRKLLLAGFSFGAYISAMQSFRLNCELLISIAPPIGRIEFIDFVPPECPWMVIQGDQDELVDLDKVESWVDSFKSPPEFYKMSDASHFFHGKLTNLRSVIEAFAIKSLNLQD